MEILGALVSVLTVLAVLILCIFVLMLVIAFLAVGIFLAVAFLGWILSFTTLWSHET